MITALPQLLSTQLPGEVVARWLAHQAGFGLCRCSGRNPLANPVPIAVAILVSS